LKILPKDGQLPPLYHRPMEEVSAFILAGGKSTRMGTDKAFVLLEGRTLLSRVLDLARQLTSKVHIIGDPAKFAPFAPTIEDVFPGCGPLGGIHAALRSSPTDLNVILAVDVPFVSLALLDYLISRATSSDANVTVARAAGGFQPLCAVYRRPFADAAEDGLRARHYKIDTLFTPATTQVIEEAELETSGFSSRIFRNLNTPEELAEAHE
jgi:molybdopterin-guanine dinucleotide biosynthesis protein A